MFLRPNIFPVSATLFAMILVTAPARAQSNDWTPEQAQVLDAIAALSASTAEGGEGAQAYAAVLHEDFSRWTVGSQNLNRKEGWVRGMDEWLRAGWRVTDRQAQVLEIVVEGRRAYSRRIVSESFRGPNGEEQSVRAAIAEVWVQEDGRWLLWRVDLHAMDP